MLNGSSAGSFADDIIKWQKRLQTIEAVLTVWLEVQEKWVELEDVSSVFVNLFKISTVVVVFTSVPHSGIHSDAFF